MRPPFFPLTNATDLMNRHNTLASEFGVFMNDDWPIHRFQQMSDAAIKRRNERIEAATEGKHYVG